VTGIPVRPRRNRLSPAIRALVRETELSPADLVWPLFLHDRPGSLDIPAMPGCQRHGIDAAVAAAAVAVSLGVRAVALFPAIAEGAKDPEGTAGLDPEGLVPRAIRALKAAHPWLVVVADVALDPYSSDGHDGVVRGGRIDNDASLPLLAALAVVQARAGADVVAPSDMMDGRIAAVRAALDGAGLADTLICSYCAKYASAFYGPFRAALDSAPRTRAGIPGDKRTYQMDPANAREALREAALDEAEGADWLLVKPGLPYLDIITRLRAATTLPLAAYHVSGEYAMLRAAAANGWIDYPAALMESLTALRRAGAGMIFTYGALDAARLIA
jgi:porphobilinogen synthase